MSRYRHDQLPGLWADVHARSAGRPTAAGRAGPLPIVDAATRPARPSSCPPAQPRRPITVYECDSCGARDLGTQYCGDCHTFMRRVGVGGTCPSCFEAVAVTELLDQQP